MDEVKEIGIIRPPKLFPSKKLHPLQDLKQRMEKVRLAFLKTTDGRGHCSAGFANAKCYGAILGVNCR